MAYAITELLGHRDSSRILPMLRQDFVLKIPATLPYGGEFTGPEAFAKFFAGTPGGAAVWESFDVHVDQVIESADYLVARLTNTAVLKATGKTVVFRTYGSSRPPAAAWSAPSSTRTRPLSAAMLPNQLRFPGGAPGGRTLNQWVKSCPAPRRDRSTCTDSTGRYRQNAHCTHIRGALGPRVGPRIRASARLL
jgi:hypothetical protein